MLWGYPCFGMESVWNVGAWRICCQEMLSLEMREALRRGVGFEVGRRMEWGDACCLIYLRFIVGYTNKRSTSILCVVRG